MQFVYRGVLFKMWAIHPVSIFSGDYYDILAWLILDYITTLARPFAVMLTLPSGAGSDPSKGPALPYHSQNSNMPSSSQNGVGSSLSK